jgi:hypothetical protein
VHEANLPPSTWNVRSLAIVGWGSAGVLALLGQAIWRLTPFALEPLRRGRLERPQAALYVAWVLAAAYTEGYRAFQRGFSPRVVARAVYLARRPKPLRVLLAPAFCLSLFHANRRAHTRAWGLLITMIALVVIVHHTPQPWRGIVDGGVVVGLVWGEVALLRFLVRALAGYPIPVRINLPEQAA